MTEHPDLQAVHDAVALVKHLEIDNTLIELGMVDGIAIEYDEGEGKDVVGLTLRLPMLDIPVEVRDHLIQSLYMAVTHVGYGLNVQIVEMDEAERQHFFALAQQNWKGV